MKIRIDITVELDDERTKILLAIAKSCGHDFDKSKKVREVIRRYLESRVKDAVTYAHEHMSGD